MDGTIRILAVCPNCGNSTWIRREDDEAEGAFECAACGDLVFTEDMSLQGEDETKAG